MNNNLPEMALISTQEMATFLSSPPDVLRLYTKDIDPCSYMCVKMTCKRLNSIFPKLTLIDDSAPMHVINHAIRTKRLHVVTWLLGLDHGLMETSLCHRAAKAGFKHFFRWLELNHEGFLQQCISRNDYGSSLMRSALKWGHLELAQWLKSRSSAVSCHDVTAAARSGSLKVFKWSMLKYEKKITSWPEIVIAAAKACRPNSSMGYSSAGSFQVLEWLNDYSLVKPFEEIELRDVWSTAIRLPSMPLIQWLHGHQYMPTSSQTRLVFLYPNSEVLSFFLHNYRSIMDSHILIEEPFVTFSHYNAELRCIQLLIEAGYRPLSNDWSFTAIHCGRLDILKYMVSIGIAFEPRARSAISTGRHEVLRWLIDEIGLIPDCSEIISMSHDQRFNDIIDGLLKKPAVLNSLTVSSMSLIYSAALSKVNMSLVRILMTHGFHLPICVSAVEHDLVHILLRIKHQQNLTDDMKAILQMAANDHLFIIVLKDKQCNVALQYLEEHEKSPYL